MGDTLIKPGEGGKVGEVDLTKYVPKEEQEKLSSQIKELQDSKKDLEGKLDEAKLSLLDPKYVAFLESDRGKKIERKVDKALSDISDDDIEHLSSKQLLNLAVVKAKEAILSEVIPAYEDTLRRQGSTISDILAVLELQQVEDKHADFDSYRDAVKKILDTSRTPLTIEQAYMIAKGENPPKASEEPKGGNKPSSEKPGGNLPSDMKPKTFNTKEEAGTDAWDTVVGRDKDHL